MLVFPCFYCVFSHTLHTSAPVSDPHTAKHRTNPCTLLLGSRMGNSSHLQGLLKLQISSVPEAEKEAFLARPRMVHPQRSVTCAVNSAPRLIARLVGSSLTFQESHTIENN